MKNATDLRNELVKVFEDLKSGEIGIKQAKASVGITNSILKSAALEAEYSKFTNNPVPIEFLETPKSKD